METLKVGIREFRENLADYLESGAPLALTRHCETLGSTFPRTNAAAWPNSKPWAPPGIWT